jgi:hypothetical protein
VAFLSFTRFSYGQEMGAAVTKDSAGVRCSWRVPAGIRLVPIFSGEHSSLLFLNKAWDSSHLSILELNSK